MYIHTIYNILKHVHVLKNVKVWEKNILIWFIQYDIPTSEWTGWNICSMTTFNFIDSELGEQTAWINHQCLIKTSPFLWSVEPHFCTKWFFILNKIGHNTTVALRRSPESQKSDAFHP